MSPNEPSRSAVVAAPAIPQEKAAHTRTRTHTHIQNGTLVLNTDRRNAIGRRRRQPLECGCRCWLDQCC